MTTDEYCREIETYLCRKNDGHLIRIVGPSFDRVTGWAGRGVPLKVAFRGIDRYFDRYYARGPRRRPVRIDFCEADVLDVFDEWRRAVGMLQPEERARISLPSHLDRVILQLTTLRRSGAAVEFDAALERAVRELDVARQHAKSIRGDARARLVDRLRDLDRDLVAAARAACPPDQLARLRAEAEDQLLPYRDRMPDAALRQAVQAAVDRLVRDLAGLPAIAID